MSTKAVSIVTYNRGLRIAEIIEGVLSTAPDGTDIFVCDDGSTDNTAAEVARFSSVSYYRGPNLGVGANKNRALYLMKNHHYSAIIEDDLVPIEKNWFERYEAAAALTDIHHFCRVQDKQVAETSPVFSNYLNKAMQVTPIYASSPRGDFTFITRKVITTVGGFSPEFKGVGYAHVAWSARVARAGLIIHPLNWVDLKEARDCFKQIGDTEGGRWLEDKEEIKKQLHYNKLVAKNLEEKNLVYVPLRIC